MTADVSEEHKEARPEFLYRFRSLATEDDVRRLEPIICESRIWLSKPSRFNDPFECRPRLSFRGAPRELKSYAKLAVKELYPGLNWKQKQSREIQFQTMLVRNPEPSEELVASYFHDFAVLSLSEDETNIITWAHYADGHRGIALGFDFRQDKPSIFSLADKVKYQDDYPVCQLVRMQPKDFYQAALLTKATGWAYEKEWRIIVRNLTPAQVAAVSSDKGIDASLRPIFAQERGEGAYHYPPELLSKIIFGAQIDEHQRARILDWIERRPVPTLVLQARRRPSSFGIDFEPVQYRHKPAKPLKRTEIPQAVVHALVDKPRERAAPMTARQGDPVPR